MKKTLYQKIWDSHLVREKEGENALLYIDLHLVHEVTSPQAFAGLRLQKRKVRCASKVLATMDHMSYTSTYTSFMNHTKSHIFGSCAKGECAIKMNFHCFGFVLL